MRVLLVNDLAPVAGSGVEVQVGVLAEALEAAGHTVAVFAGEVRHAGARRTLDVWDPWARRALSRRAEAFSPDVVHHHNVLRELSVSVLGVPAGAGCVLSVHDVRLLAGCEGYPPPHPWSPPAVAKRAKAVFDRAVVRRRVDVVIAHSHDIQQRLGRARLGPSLLVPVISALPVARPSEDLDRADAPPPSACTDVVYAGRLSVEKGVDVLVDAFLTVASAHPAARLLIAGDGPDRSRLQAAVGRSGGRVQLLGRVERDEVARRLRSARLVAVPSRGPEGGPMVVVEAAMAGRPVVVSAVTGATEVVEAAGCGLVVEPGDAVALSRALDRLLGDPLLADRLGAAGHRFVAERHTPAVAVAALERAYAMAVDRARLRRR